MDIVTRRLARERAGDHCEYCGLHQSQEVLLLRFHVEHIIARQHGGGDDLENLALACFHCNAHKGTNLSAIDRATSSIVMVFHPRQQRWQEHFRRRGTCIEGITPTGRATVKLLKMNVLDRRRLR